MPDLYHMLSLAMVSCNKTLNVTLLIFATVTFIACDSKVAIEPESMAAEQVGDVLTRDADSTQVSASIANAWVAIVRNNSKTASASR